MSLDAEKNSVEVEMEAKPGSLSNESTDLTNKRDVKQTQKSEPLTFAEKLRCGGFVFLLFIFAVFSLLFVVSSDARMEFFDLFQWFEDHPHEGVWLYVLLTTVANDLGVPVIIFEIVAGYVFPLYYAILEVYSARLLTAFTCWYPSRYLMKESILSFCAKKPMFRNLSRAIQENEVRVMFLLRIAYMPLWLKNYVLPVFVTRVKLYYLFCVICAIPAGSIYIFIGANADGIVKILNGESQGGSSELILNGLAALVLILVAIYMGVLTKKLKKEMSKYDQEEANQGELEDSTPKDTTKLTPVVANNSSKGNNEEQTPLLSVCSSWGKKLGDPVQDLFKGPV